MPKDGKLFCDNISWQRFMFWLFTNKHRLTVHFNFIHIQEKAVLAALEFAKNKNIQYAMDVKLFLQKLQKYFSIFQQQWKFLLEISCGHKTHTVCSKLKAPINESILLKWKSVFHVWKLIYFDEKHENYHIIQEEINRILNYSGNNICKKCLRLDHTLKSLDINALYSSFITSVRCDIVETLREILFGSTEEQLISSREEKLIQFGNSTNEKSNELSSSSYMLIRVDDKIFNNLTSELIEIVQLFEQLNTDNKSVYELIQHLSLTFCNIEFQSIFDELLKRINVKSIKPVEEKNKNEYAVNIIRHKRKLYTEDNTELIDIE